MKIVEPPNPAHCDICTSKIDGTPAPIADVPNIHWLCAACAAQSTAAFQGFRAIALTRADAQHREWLMKARAARG